jgi:kumamolisin
LVAFWNLSVIVEDRLITGWQQETKMPDKLIALKGSLPANKHKLIGPADPKERIEVTIKLRRKSEEGLPTLDQFVAGKRSVGITRQILSERYGASQPDADAVHHWAVQQGLSVSGVDLGRRQMHLVGSIDAMARAFGVKLFMYQHSRTRTQFHFPDGDIKVPETLVPIITGVFGLSDMPVAVRHAVRVATQVANANPKQQFPGSFYPNEVAKLYNFPSTQGVGQRVAVLEFGGGFDQSVLAGYFTQNIGLPAAPTVNAIFVLGAQMQLNDGATGEVYLDVEVIGAMAPQATIDVYFAPWTGEGYLNAIDQAIHNDDYAAVSISYGLDEDLSGTAADPGWPMLNTNIDEAFRDATAVGIPVFVSTGDQGSSSLRGQLTDGTEITLFSPTAHAGYPATSPYATAVGGTMLYAQNGAITQEVVWNELGDLQQGKFYYGGATGGGVSDRYTTVPSYQTSAGLNPQSINNPPAQGRGVPDVAGNAGSTTGYLVSQPPGSQVPIAPVGGTSAAAPMWAALMACVRESLSTTLNGKVPVFFLNDFIYANGKTAAFRDIVGGRQFTFDPNQGLVAGAFTAIGNNCSTQVNGYNAAPGYDLCTGWGSPNGNALLQQLQTWLASQPTG